LLGVLIGFLVLELTAYSNGDSIVELCDKMIKRHDQGWVFYIFSFIKAKFSEGSLTLIYSTLTVIGLIAYLKVLEIQKKDLNNIHLFAFLLILFTILGLNYYLFFHTGNESQNIKVNDKAPCIFNKLNQKKTNVLILNWTKDEKDIVRSNVYERIRKHIEKYSSNFEIYTCISNSYSEPVLLEKFKDFDLILFGDYYDSLNGCKDDVICYNHFVTTNTLRYHKNSLDTVALSYEFEISQGKGQVTYDYLIELLLGISAYKLKSPGFGYVHFLKANKLEDTDESNYWKGITAVLNNHLDVAISSLKKVESNKIKENCIYSIVLACALSQGPHKYAEAKEIFKSTRNRNCQMTHSNLTIYSICNFMTDDYAEALKSNTEAFKIALTPPDSIWNLFHFSIIYSEMGLNDSLKLYYSQTFKNQLIFEYGLLDHLHVRPKGYDIDKISKLLKANSSDPILTFMYASHLHNRGKFNESKEYFRNTISIIKKLTSIESEDYYEDILKLSERIISYDFSRVNFVEM